MGSSCSECGGGSADEELQMFWLDKCPTEVFQEPSPMPGWDLLN